MNHSDIINGLFEGVGGLLLFRNCYQLYIDKQVRGVSVSTVFFFLVWGLWNIFFYPMNGLWYSFTGGLIIAIANILWVSMALFYSNKNLTK